MLLQRFGTCTSGITDSFTIIFTLSFLKYAFALASFTPWNLLDREFATFSMAVVEILTTPDSFSVTRYFDDLVFLIPEVRKNTFRHKKTRPIINNIMSYLFD